MARCPIDVHLLVPYVKGTKVSFAYLAQDLAVLFDKNRPLSITRCLSDSSGGIVELEPWVSPETIVEVEPETLRILGAPGGRALAIKKAQEVLEEVGRPFKSGGPAVIFIGGMRVDVGKGGGFANDRFMSVALLDDASPFSLICHEIAHTLGYQHPYDLRLPPPLGNQEYGDRADVMSSLRVNGFQMPEGDREFAPRSPLWSVCGPGLSPATTWRYAGGYPRTPEWVRRLEPDAASTRVQLHAGSAPGSGGTRLIAMPGKGSIKWYAVQYKAKKSWDRAIYPEFGDVPGVVQIFAFQDVVWPTRTEPEPACLIAELVKADGKTFFRNSDLEVRIDSCNDLYANVTVGRTVDFRRAVTLDVTLSSQVLESRRTGETASVSRVGPQCKAQTYPVVRTAYRVSVTARANLREFVSPFLRFEVGGEPVGTWASASEPKFDAATVPFVEVNALVPTALRASSMEKRTIGLIWSTERTELLFDVTFSFLGPNVEGKFPLAVKVYASESPGTDNEAISAEQTVEVVTTEYTLPPEVARDQAACIRAHMQVAQPSWKKLKGLDGTEEPDWTFHPELTSALRVHDFTVGGPGLLELLKQDAAGNDVAQLRLREAAAALEVAPEVLREAGKGLDLRPGP